MAIPEAWCGWVSRCSRTTKRGAGASSGVYLQSREHSADALLRRLAADAAAAFSELAADPEVDTTRVGFFGASQAGWIIPLAAELTRTRPRFQVILSGNAVSTGVEQYYSDLTGDGSRPPQVADRAEIERRVLGFTGKPGFDPGPILLASRTPTLWLLGDRDQQLNRCSRRFACWTQFGLLGNDRHTVIRYPNADHALRDVASGNALPVWNDMMTWLRQIHILKPPR